MVQRTRVRLRALLRKSQTEQELDEELRYHLDKEIERNIARGMAPEEARRAALRRFGSVEQIKERSRDARGVRWLEDIWRDLRYAARMLARTRVLTLTAAVILALGIGANTAVFSLVDFFLIGVLPVKDPQQLVLVDRALSEGRTEGDFTYPAFEQLRDLNSSLSGIFAFDNTHVSVTVDGEPELVWGDFVSGCYFGVLGASAVVGRTLTPEDDSPGQPPVAVISNAYWEGRFGRSPNVLGRTIYAGKVPCTIIGITAPRFLGLYPGTSSPSVILPMSLHAQLALRDHDTFDIVGRLRPGVKPDQACADLDAIYQQVRMQQAGTEKANSSGSVNFDKPQAEKIILRPGFRGLFNPNGRLASELRMLFAIVAAVFLIALVNVANLLLARASGRRKEMAVRLAVGAGRGRLIRQLLIESVMLALFGAALGLLCAHWGIPALMAILAYGRGATSFSLMPDARVLGFTAALSMAGGVLLGLAPALTATSVGFAPVLKNESAQASTRRRWLTRSLVAAQIGLSLTLLIGAGLLIRSLVRLNHVDTGFERERVITLGVYPALLGYDHDRELLLYREVIGKLSGIPGVRSATFTRLSLDNRAGPVGPRFFETMGISILRGREFADADMGGGPKIAIVSESLARKFFPGEDPLGKRLPSEWLAFEELRSPGDVQIIGIARDVKHRLRSHASTDDAYIPYTQAPARMLGQGQFLVRAAADPASLIPAIRQVVQSVEKDLPLDKVSTISEELYDSLGQERSMTTLLAAFAVVAMLLASIGLYGTISHSVASRTKEIGIRMALGARRRGVLWMVLGETLTLFAIGVGIGLLTALVAVRLISELLFGVTAADPLSILVSVAVMLATAVAAGYIPAWRAGKINPTVALRYE